MRNFLVVIMCIALFSGVSSLRSFAEVPDTGISGVFEAMVGVDNEDFALRYFSEFGFREISRSTLGKDQALEIYGVPSALVSIRLQSGDIDSHGLLRILVWETPLGPGVGYAPPETVGARMAVMRTNDIIRIADVFKDWQENHDVPLLIAGPVYDDLYDTSAAKPDLFNRRAGVREMAVYGSWFNHVFFQRYGYSIPGYGTVDEGSPLGTSELTHHDFFVAGDLDEVTAYYESVFGLTAENERAVIDGAWQPGPQAVFRMNDGRSHWYRGFVSPNNICGKLKFFSVHDLHTPQSRAERQSPGELGITLHSFWTPRLDKVRQLAIAEGLHPSQVQENEFGERSFLLKGPDGVSWQIIQRERSQRPPETEFQLIEVTN